MGQGDDRVRFWDRLAQLGVAVREEMGLSIAMGTAEASKVGVGQAQGRFGGRVGYQKSKGDLSFDLAEQSQGLGVVTQEDSLQAVAVGSDGLGQAIDQAQLGLHPTHQLAIRLPGSKAMPVRAQQVGNEKSITVVVVRPAGAVTIPIAADDTGRNDVEAEASGPEEVDQQVVGRLQSDQIVRERQAHLVDLGFKVREA